jgi:hemerythrin-like domain-containing protein
MPAEPTPTDFAALDACHLQIQKHLAELAQLSQQLKAAQPDAKTQKKADAIERFFSSTSRDHHLQEEETVFPALLASGDPELVAAVKTLQQDHGWIEENWISLAPQLRGIASGMHWVDPDEFQHAVNVFLELCQGHIALEETLIYPESKARWARAVAARRERLRA